MKLNRLQTSLPKSRKIKTHPVPSRVQQFSILQTSVNFLPSLTFVTIVEVSCFKNSYHISWIHTVRLSGAPLVQTRYSPEILINSENNRWTPIFWSEKLKNHMKILLTFLDSIEEIGRQLSNYAEIWAEFCTHMLKVSTFVVLYGFD